MNKNWQSQTSSVYRILIDQVLSIRKKKGVWYRLYFHHVLWIFGGVIFITKLNQKEYYGFTAKD